MSFLSDLSFSQAILLFVGLAIAFGFEFVNGFHDTANAVATVIYTRSMHPVVAVVWSGFCNFLGVILGGIGVAYAIVYLLPVELLIGINTDAGLAMVLSLLLSAISWNLGTWYFGLPTSSSHSLIGAILGAALIHHLTNGQSAVTGVNWSKASEVGLSLFLSPLIGFFVAAMLLLLMKRLFPSPSLHNPPPKDAYPPFLVRAVLVGTCSGVSFVHGSNDGQKGMGLIMVVLIGIVPAHFALNQTFNEEQIQHVVQAAGEVDGLLQDLGIHEPASTGADLESLPVSQRVRTRLALVRSTLAGKRSFRDIPEPDRWAFRVQLLNLNKDLKAMESLVLEGHGQTEKKDWQRLVKTLKGPMEYVPIWVVVGVAMALGIGTTIGWRRIVVTVGEKIGKAHLTYSQGACAETVAMLTIGLASVSGLPVSTTHVLSSGVAGTMWANRSGLQRLTLRKIAMAWFLTLPATMLLSCVFYLIARVFV
jgi:inorganic phosphate transporter, PiT family